MIVCDTMIWYGLNNEIVEKLSLKGKLVCTHSTLIELCSTHKIYRSPEEVKHAIRAIRDFGVIRSHHNPFSYGLLNFLQSYRPNPHSSIRRWESLIHFLDFEYIVNKEMAENAKLSLDEYNKDFIGSIDYMNQTAIPIKAINKSRKEQVKKRDYIKVSRIYIAELLLQYFREQPAFNGAAGISLNSDKWNNFELFIEVLAAFFKDIDSVPNQKIHENDWADILNMIYVNPNDQYWTEEKKWKRYINNNVNIAKYLFQPHSTN